jgi:hypothetical protein
MSTWEESVRQFYIEGFNQHYEYAKQARSQHLELWEFLESQSIEFEGDIIMEFFLNVTALGWMKDSKNRVGIPGAVLEAYDFYKAIRHEQVTVSKVSVQDRNTYAVRVRTDGDDGWLEVFDDQGKLIGSSLTFLDIVSWEDREAIREKFKTLDFDWCYRLQALSHYYPPRQSS